MTTPPDTLERTWADQWAPEAEVQISAPEPEPVERAPLALALLVISAFAVAGMAAISLFGVLDSDESGPATEVAGAVEDGATATTATPATAAPTTAAPTTATPTTAAPTTAAPTTEAPTTSEAPTTTVAPDATVGGLDASDPAAAAAALSLVGEDATRTAVFSGGIVYLRGQVPTQEVADAIAERVGAVVGPDNVVVEYEINPDAPVPDSAPLYVDDKILFEVDSSEINPGFVPLLDLGTSLMQMRDTVTVAVIAHTDSVGAADYNMALSERRAQAVKDFWVDAGIDPNRIVAVGLGETAPEADNVGATGRAANRRAEFIVQGILG